MKVSTKSGQDHLAVAGKLQGFGDFVSDDDPLLVDCGPHGKRVAAVVCRHMVDEKNREVGFVENSSDPNDLQAWCDDCESLYLEEGEMTDRFREFNKMAVVCVVCYSEMKERHSHRMH